MGNLTGRIPKLKTTAPIQTKSYHISRGVNGIVKKHILPDSHIDLDEVKECEKLSYTINGRKKMLTLIDASNFHTLTPEAAHYLKKIQSVYRIATAIVSSSVSQKILTGYMQSKKSPMKTFALKMKPLSGCWHTNARFNLTRFRRFSLPSRAYEEIAHNYRRNTY